MEYYLGRYLGTKYLHCAVNSLRSSYFLVPRYMGGAKMVALLPCGSRLFLRLFLLNVQSPHLPFLFPRLSYRRSRCHQAST